MESQHGNLIVLRTDLTGHSFVHVAEGLKGIEGRHSMEGQEMPCTADSSPSAGLQWTASPVKITHAHTVATSPVRARRGR